MARESLKQISTEKKRGRPKGLPKTGGRQKGAVNKVTREVRDWARGILEDPEVQARTLRQAQEGKLAPAVFNELLHYAYGKPKDTVEVSGPHGSPLAAIARVIVDRDDAAD